MQEDVPLRPERSERIGEQTLSVLRVGVDVDETFEPHLVLLDLELPDMSGFEVARQLRGQTGLCQPLLVALTGHVREEDRLRCREAGFDRHMAKPVEPGPLKALIASLAG